MAELTALVVIFFLYILPLNLVLYRFCEKMVGLIQVSENSIVMFIKEIPGISRVISIFPGVLASLFYVLITAALFFVMYIFIKHYVVKSIFLYREEYFDDEGFMKKYKVGQGGINRIALALITAAMVLHIVFRSFNIRLFVFYLLCIIFIYKSVVKEPREKQEEKKTSPSKSTEASGEGTAEIDASGEAGENSEIIEYEWAYKKDPFSIEQPVRFKISMAVSLERYREYQGKEHRDNSPEALRKQVIDGLCPEVVELAKHIKKICEGRNLNTYHQVSAVMALQQSMKYVYDIDSKGVEEYIRYPLETLVEKEGDCDCHAICSASILYSMGYDIVLLRIIYPDGSGHLALAVEGADGIPGNFFKHNNRRYYYCEVTPGDNSSMSFRVGEMPEIPGANISIVQVKESISRM